MQGKVNVVRAKALDVNKLIMQTFAQLLKRVVDVSFFSYIKSW